MPISRREIMQWIATASSLAMVAPGRAASIPFSVDEASEFQSKLLPSTDEVWKWQVWMNNLGPKYTGNAAHKAFVEFLASNLQKAGLELTRDTYKFPRWDARKWAISVTPRGGQTFDVPVTSYYPYSGKTPQEGVTGELVYGGTPEPLLFFQPFKTSGDIRGKIVLINIAAAPYPYQEYKLWGRYVPNVTLPDRNLFMVTAGPTLTALKEAGALGAVIAWTNVSDEAAADQYAPFGRAFQDLPALYVGRESGATLQKLVGARVTLTLEADVFPDTPTDTLVATLPGVSSEEVIIVNTHTDGTNATEENGGLGVLALAQYFSKLPKASRKRTLVFVLATGHFAFSYVPAIQGFVSKHPDLIEKAVASLTLEHLGCREWLDNGTTYAASGEDELSLAITEFESTANLMLDALQNTGDRRVAVVKPDKIDPELVKSLMTPGAAPPSAKSLPKAFYVGEGGALSSAGVPNIGYIPIPSYLVATPKDGCISKLSSTHMYDQIQAFAKVVHKMDTMPAADLKRG